MLLISEHCPDSVRHAKSEAESVQLVAIDSVGTGAISRRASPPAQATARQQRCRDLPGDALKPALRWCWDVESSGSHSSRENCLACSTLVAIEATHPTVELLPETMAQALTRSQAVLDANEIDPHSIEICKRSDGTKWCLGSGSYGTVRLAAAPPRKVPCTRRRHCKYPLLG